jgi:RNA polymerase sigma-70 factor (ECF subfamily)
VDADRDAELRQRMIAGDALALGEAYDDHAGAVFGVAWRMLGDRPSAEDIVQDVFLRLWQRPEGYDPARGRLRAWLCAAARHRAIDQLRRAETYDRCLRLLAAGLLARVPDPADPAIRDVMAEAVRVAVGALPEPQRIAVMLAYYGGLSYREVAVALGIAEGTAKSRLRLGLRTLAASLSDQGLLDG